MAHVRSTVVRTLIIAWGLGGVVALLGQAITRLAPIALEPVLAGMTTLEWSVLVLWCVFNAHAEGYRGFHRSFSPRVVARAFYLADHGRPWQVMLGPAYCMSLFHSTRRGMTVAWTLVIGITLLVILVRQLDQPWRGIIDAGVVIGLGLGLLSVGWHFVRALRVGGPTPSDLPPAMTDG